MMYSIFVGDINHIFEYECQKCNFIKFWYHGTHGQAILQTSFVIQVWRFKWQSHDSFYSKNPLFVLLYLNKKANWKEKYCDQQQQKFKLCCFFGS